MSSFGFQSWMFGDLISQVQVLKAGVPSVGFKSLSPQRETLGGTFLAGFYSFFPRETFSTCTSGFSVSIGGGRFRIFLHHTLTWNPYIELMLKYTSFTHSLFLLTHHGNWIKRCSNSGYPGAFQMREMLTFLTKYNDFFHMIHIFVLDRTNNYNIKLIKHW